MNELKITLDHVNPLTVWGSNNEYFEITKKHFSKIKIVARGNEVKALGDENELILFKEKFQGIIDHVDKFQSLNTNDLEHILGAQVHFGTEGSSVSEKVSLGVSGFDPIVFGPNGIVVKARTVNQRNIV